MHAGREEQAGRKAGQSKQSGSEAEQSRQLGRAVRVEEAGREGRPVILARQRRQVRVSKQAQQTGRQDRARRQDSLVGRIDQSVRQAEDAGRQSVQGRAGRSEMSDRQVRDAREVGREGGGVTKGRAGR
jgi:hypothetical protein